MSVRSYGQYCGLAIAMDLLGQRWALLVIRDLAPGPRRFTDLFEGLPGIATDVLADRLRAFEAAGVIEQRSLRHPVPAKVYELTESGHALARIAADLALWGQRLMPPPGSTDARVQPRWALQSMAAGYSGGVADGSYEITIDGDQLNVVIDGDVASVQYGPPVEPPRLTMRFSQQQFFAVLRNPAHLRRPHRGVVIDGDPDLAEALFVSMPMHIGIDPSKSAAQ